jgi:hypothetical protein
MLGFKTCLWFGIINLVFATIPPYSLLNIGSLTAACICLYVAYDLHKKSKEDL